MIKSLLGKNSGGCDQEKIKIRKVRGESEKGYSGIFLSRVRIAGFSRNVRKGH